MKPFLAFNRTEDRCACEDYKVGTISEKTNKEWKQFIEERDKIIKRSKLNRFISHLSLCLVIIGALTLFQSLKMSLFEEKHSSNPTLFIINISVSSVCFVGYFLITKLYKTKAVRFDEKSRRLEKATVLELNLPEEYVMAEVVYFQYEEKNGDFVPFTQHPKGFYYFNPIYIFFVEKDNFHIATESNCYAVPLTSLKRIKKIEKSLILPFWKKHEHFTSSGYKEFNIHENKDSIETDYYYSLEFSIEDKSFYISFPPYELHIFEKLTGLSVTTE